MKKRNIHILCGLCLFCFFSFGSYGQCLSRDSLWQRLVFLRDCPGKAPSSDDQLRELLNYKDQIDKCSYRNDSTHALLLQRIAVLYSKEGDFARGISFLKQSISITENQNNRATNPKHLIRSYFVLSFFYGELGRIIEKMKAIDNCIAAALKTKSIDKYVLDPMWNKIDYLYDIGDYKGACDIADVAASSIKLYHQKDSLEYLIGFQAQKTKALLALGRVDSLQTGLANKIAVSRKNGEVLNLGTMLDQMAKVLAKTNDYVGAEKYFLEAYKHDLKNQYKFGCSQILNTLGYTVYFKHDKDYDKSINTFKKALSFLNDPELAETSYDFERLNVYADIACVFVEKKLYDSSAKYFQYAFDQVQKGISEQTIFTSPVLDTIQYKRVPYLIQMMTLKGDSYVKRYKEKGENRDLKDAINIYKHTDQLLDRIRKNQYEVQSKLFWRKDSRKLYESALEASLLDSDNASAFYFFEKSRAVLLSDQLKEEKWLSETDILDLAQLKKKILLKEREADELDKSSVEYQNLQKDIFSFKQELNTLKSALADKMPVKSLTDSFTITIEDVQKKLEKDHKTIIELFEGENSVYSIMITSGSAKIARINKIQFDSLSRLYVYLLSDPVILNKRYSDFIKVSKSLYDFVFQDLKINSDRVIISPDSHYFPFEALITSISAGQPRYFIEDHVISYTYSARFLFSDFHSGTVKDVDDFIGFAPVNYPDSYSLASLNGSDKSLDNISRQLSNSLSFISSTATRSNFMHRFSHYKIIQLYTHASGNSEYNEPVIYFADSALYLSDLISENKPAARLIVLSACETGSGKDYTGEGIFSFNRGFAALGIPSSVTNLWTIDNESTYKITELFYKYMWNGLSLDDALQKAKLDFIKSSSKEKRLPYYWAAAILVGNTESIQTGKSNHGVYYIDVIVTLAVIFILVILFRKRRKPILIPDIAETAS